MANNCAAEIFRDFFSHSCPRRGVVERDGVFYCRTHDPVAVQAKRDAKAAEQRDAGQADSARKQAAEHRAKKIGRGFPHQSRVSNGVWEYTGGVVLTPEECDSLAEELDRMAKRIDDLLAAYVTVGGDLVKIAHKGPVND